MSGDTGSFHQRSAMAGHPDFAPNRIATFINSFVPGRKKNRAERPVAPRREIPVIQRAKVDGVDDVNRTVNITWANKSGSRMAVPIYGPPGDYSLPSPGDTVLVALDREDLAFVVGYRDIGFPNRTDANQIFKFGVGEWGQQAKSSKQRIVFKNDGTLELLTAREEGCDVMPGQRTRLRSQNLIELLTPAVKQKIGEVRRRFAGGFPLVPAPDNTIPELTLGGAAPAQEWSIDVNYFPVPPPFSILGRAARLAFGTSVIDDMGLPEMGSFGSKLRGVIQVSLLGGIPLSEIAMDEGGNFEITSIGTSRIVAMMCDIFAAQVAVKAASIDLGFFPFDNPLLGKLFTAWFNIHMHSVPQSPSGVQMSTPPIPQIPSDLVTSKNINIGYF